MIMDWTKEMKAAAMDDAQNVVDQSNRIAELEAREELLHAIVARFVPLDYIWRDKAIKEHLQG